MRKWRQFSSFSLTANSFENSCNSYERGRCPRRRRPRLVHTSLVHWPPRLQDSVRLSINPSSSLSPSLSSRIRYRSRPRSPLATSPHAPGVSILRPLKGLDTNLYENLESTFTQEYPNFEILVSVAHHHDQALTIVRDLIAKHPHVNARIIIGMLSLVLLTFPDLQS